MTTRLVLGAFGLAALAGPWTTPAGAQPAAAAPSAPAVPAVLHVPDGFAVTVFASDLPRARLMAVSPEGVLVVARRTDVVALPDADGDGRAEPRVLFADLPYAHSVAFGHGYLYIATTPAVLRVKWRHGAPDGVPERIVELPSSTPSLHTSRSLAIGPDGKLYVSIGSSCNACVEADPRRTTIQVFEPDGTGGRTFARGLRNAVGFAWDPATGRLWAGEPGQDNVGDDAPAEEINLIEDGRHYGHPFFYGRNLPSTAPDAPSGPAALAAAEATPAAFELPAHMTPMGLAFYSGSRFPEPYRTSMYLAVHGSTTRSAKVGYKVVRLVMENGRPVRSEDFVTGWLNGDTVTGRPVGVVTGADGALYVSDDNKGFIYRVAATAKPPAGSNARQIVTHRVPPMDGTTLSMQVVEVSYAPGGWSESHRHPCPVVGYVLEGAVRMQLQGQPERIYRAGESFVETPADVHAVSANASDTTPARFLAFFTCDREGPRSIPAPGTPAPPRPGGPQR
jgi:glucose/arabinose dehydrogenase/quercetin dioxygenase-like cupin family protein